MKDMTDKLVSYLKEIKSYWKSRSISNLISDETQYYE